LWSFNEEIVARAIAASRIPIITGIGHEVDCSISDLVADYHAHTPTEAAHRSLSQNWKRADRLCSRKSEMRACVSIVRQNVGWITAIDWMRSIVMNFSVGRWISIQLFRQLLDDRQKAINLALSGRGSGVISDRLHGARSAASGGRSVVFLQIRSDAHGGVGSAA
jgi:hypothetical protein